MKRKCAFAVTIVVLLLLASCSTGSEPASQPATPGNTGDPLTGTWSGNWGTSAQDRNDVTFQLKWDGTSLSGTVNPGPSQTELTKASYDPATGTVAMETDGQQGGATVHYVIEGKIDGPSMSGSWSYNGGKGDFKVTKS